MGVTNRNELQYPKPDQIPNQDSLYIPLSSSQTSLVSTSDNETVPVISNITRRRRAKRHNFVSDISLSPRRHAGRRRQRRHNAVCELKALIEEEEIEELESLPYRSPFTVLLENPELETVWNKFTQQDEKQQGEMMDQVSAHVVLKQKAMLSYGNISQRIRTSFKTLRDFYELDRLETEIVQFFGRSPAEIYCKDDKSSFQRLLIHGIAQYYTLKSTSFEGENGKRTIKVLNPNDFCTISGKRLSELVQENRKKYL